MDVRDLAISGAWEVSPQLLGDPRGMFLEAYKSPVVEGLTGHKFTLKQVNCSVSAAGVIRGVHFAAVPPGQAKYVMCPTGAVLDIVVDIRVGSPTFAHWDSVLLDDVTRRAVYLSEGLGHAFVSLADASTVVYLCSEGYNPGREFGIHPLDPTLAIAWPTQDRAGRELRPQLSAKDLAAPTLVEAQEQGLLPTADAVAEFLRTLP